MNFLLSLSFVLQAFSFVHAGPISSEEIATKSSRGWRLLSLAEGVNPIWKTEYEKLEFMRSGIKFVSLFLCCWGLSKSPLSQFDVTEVYELEQNSGNLHKVSAVAACSYICPSNASLDIVTMVLHSFGTFSSISGQAYPKHDFDPQHAGLPR
jgi:leucyl aminopeptidase